MSVRNSLVAALQNLGMAAQYTSPVTLPCCDQGEMETLRTAVSYIFHDMESKVKLVTATLYQISNWSLQKRHHHALEFFTVTQSRCSALLKWIKMVIK